MVDTMSVHPWEIDYNYLRGLNHLSVCISWLPCIHDKCAQQRMLQSANLLFIGSKAREIAMETIRKRTKDTFQMTRFRNRFVFYQFIDYVPRISVQLRCITIITAFYVSQLLPTNDIPNYWGVLWGWREWESEGCGTKSQVIQIRSLRRLLPFLAMFLFWIVLFHWDFKQRIDF